MAKPISATPTIKGKSAEKFLRRMKETEEAKPTKRQIALVKELKEMKRSPHEEAIKNNAISKIINLARDFKCCPMCGSTNINRIEERIVSYSACEDCSAVFDFPKRDTVFYDYLCSIYKNYCPTCRKITEISRIGVCEECGNDV